jgi:hypothetical protein
MTSADSAYDARPQRHSRRATVIAVVAAGALAVLSVVAVVVRASHDTDPAGNAAVWIDHAGVHLDGRTFPPRVTSPTVLALTSAGAVYGTANDYWLQPPDGPAHRIPVGGDPTGNPNSSVVGWITAEAHAVVFHAYDLAMRKIVARHRFDVGPRGLPGAQVGFARPYGVLSIDHTTAYLSVPDGLWRYDWMRDPRPVAVPRARSAVVDIDDAVRVVPAARTTGRGTLHVRFERGAAPAVPAAVDVVSSAAGLSPDGRHYVSGGFNDAAGHGFAPPVVLDTATGHARRLEVGTGTTSSVAWGYHGSIQVTVDEIAPNDAYLRTNVWVCGVDGRCARVGTVDGVKHLLLPGGPA